MTEFVSPLEARRLIEEEFVARPPAVGEVYIKPVWLEDDRDYVAQWGSRQTLLSGNVVEVPPLDGHVYLVEKRTGRIHSGNATLMLDRLAAMTPVAVE